MRVRHVLVASLAVAWLGTATAYAQEGHGSEHAIEQVDAHEHGHADAGHADHGHADAAHAEHADEAHGDEHAHHWDPSADYDGDGVASWRDRTDDRTGEANEHYQIKGLIWHTINLLLLVGVLFFFVRKPVGSFIQARADAIRTELDEADTLRRAAQERHEALVARLDHFDEEVARIQQLGDKRAIEDRQLLEQRAERAAEQIRDNVQRNIQDEVGRARDSLRREAVELAVQLAEQTLSTSVSADDQRRLARQFLDSLSAEEVDHG